MAEPQILEGFDRRYSAFISYRHMPLDRQWAKWVLDTLESYRTPADLVKRGFAARLGQMYRDEDENPASAELGDQIEKALAAADTLIVIASSHTQASQWIDREVRLFQEMGKGDRILVLLVDGEPATSYPKALLEGGKEPIAADVRPRADEPAKLLKTRAKLRLASALLGCAYDDLAKRDQQRERRRRWLIWGGSTLAATLALTLFVRNAQENERIRLERIALTISQDGRMNDRDRAYAMFSALSPSGWPFITLPPTARDLLEGALLPSAIDEIKLPDGEGRTSVLAALADGRFVAGSTEGSLFIGSGTNIEPLAAYPKCPSNSPLDMPCAVSAIAASGSMVMGGTRDGRLLLAPLNGARTSIQLTNEMIDRLYASPQGRWFASTESGRLLELDASGRVLASFSSDGAISGIAADTAGNVYVSRFSGLLQQVQPNGALRTIANYGASLRSMIMIGDQAVVVKAPSFQAFEPDATFDTVILAGPPATATAISDPDDQAIDSQPEFALYAIPGTSRFIYGNGINLVIGDVSNRQFEKMQILDEYDSTGYMGNGFNFQFQTTMAVAANGRQILTVQPQGGSIFRLDLDRATDAFVTLDSSRRFRSEICAADLNQLFRARSGEAPAC